MNAEALLRKTVHPPCTEEVTVVVPTDRRKLSIGDRFSLRIGLWLLLRAARTDERTGDLTREQVALQLARERAASATSRHLLTYDLQRQLR